MATTNYYDKLVSSSSLLWKNAISEDGFAVDDILFILRQNEESRFPKRKQERREGQRDFTVHTG